MTQLLAQAGGAKGITNPFLNPAIGSGTVDEGVSAAGKLVSSLVGGFLFFCVIFAMMYLLLGAMSWITSGGDKTKLEDARNKITNAIIGLVIVAAAWAIMILVGNWLGFDIQKLPFPTLVP